MVIITLLESLQLKATEVTIRRLNCIVFAIFGISIPPLHPSRDNLCEDGVIRIIWMLSGYQISPTIVVI